MLSLDPKARQSAATKTSYEKELLHRQVGATDRQIGLPVYELYSLTEEEIRTVERGV